MSKENYKGIWVYVEHENGQINEVVFELLAKAKELQTHFNETVTAVLLGSNVAGFADTLYAYGAEKVIALENEALSEYKVRPYADSLAYLSKKYIPSIFLFVATPVGRELAPYLMPKLDTGLTADAIDLFVDEDGDFIQTTPGFGGNILAHIWIRECRPQMVTVRPKVFAPLDPVDGAEGELIKESLDLTSDEDYQTLSREPKVFTSKPLAECKIVISAGRGVASEEDLAQLKELAELIAGDIAGSRPVVDKEWLDHDRQIGQSGGTTKADFIMNVAVSGSTQYVAGMQDSKCIFSINRSVTAPIYDISHYGAVVDYQKVLPKVIEMIKEKKAQA